MGVSTDAILFYGICFEELGTGEYPWEIGYDGYDEWMASLYGLEPPEGDYSEETRPKYNRYWNEKQKILKGTGLEIGYHCSDQYTMYYLTVKDSEIRAHRGYPESLKTLEIGEDWDAKIRDFCERADFGKDENVGWWLVSWWG